MTDHQGNTQHELSSFLGRVDRRTRWLLGIRHASPWVLAACLLILGAAIARAFGAFAISTPLFVIGSLTLTVSLVVLLACVRPWQAPDLLAAATLTDERAQLNDLLRSAFEIGSRPPGHSQRDEEERPFRELLAAACQREGTRAPG